MIQINKKRVLSRWWKIADVWERYAQTNIWMQEEESYTRMDVEGVE
jgi:hypothetical protein